VKKAHQRKGLGKTLLQFCIDAYSKKGFQNFYLHVAVTNKAAISLYLKLGFKGAMYLPNYYKREKSPYNEAFLMKLENGNKTLDKEPKKGT
jgi:ribosomal protein S18 acetylase RimI-like enzyme